MNWEQANTKPVGILRAGQPRIIARTGTNAEPPFLWYWVGDMNIAVIPGGKFDEATGAITTATGEPHGWVSPLGDMPEVTDINQAMEEHRELGAQATTPDFELYLEEQIEMAVNGIRAGVIE